MKYTWILDPGHGGVDPQTCEYTTCPDYTRDPKTWHKMHIHKFGPVYEGEFNRQIVARIAEKLEKEGIKYTILVSDEKDMSLKERIKRTNELFSKDKSCIFVSIHGNAYNGSVQGYEVFSSKGETRSDSIARVFYKCMLTAIPERKMRGIKEADFYVLKKSFCPAILTENFFFDNKDDALFMVSNEGQERIAQAHVDAILKIEKDGQQY